MSELLSLLSQIWSNWFSNVPTPQPEPTPQPGPEPMPPVQPLPTPPSTSSSVVAAINAARASEGLSPLVEDAPLDGLAQSWAASMAASGTMAHGDFASRIASVYPNTAAAENIAEGQPDAASVVAAWMGDAPHRANILGDYNRVGVGSQADESGSIYWCADFAQVI
jgi:uncharacterized protein YkwD